MLRNDDLLMIAATMSVLDTSLCRGKRELLPFVEGIRP